MPAAHLILVDGTPHDTDRPLSWDDVLDLVWTGSYNAGNMQVVRMPGSERVTTAVLVALARRSYELRETPDHLVPLFEDARLDGRRRLSFYRPGMFRQYLDADRARYEDRHGTLDGGAAWRGEDTEMARAEMLAEAV